MKIIKKFIAILLCLSIVVLCGCGSEKESEGHKLAYGFRFPVALYDDILVEECYLYSGEFLEDGSFDTCENVVALKVKNNSETDVQLMRISVTTNSKAMEFELTSLLAGSTVIVLEKSGQTLSENEKLLSFECENRADYNKKVTLKDEALLVQGNLGTINVKNISEKEIQSDIYVYYKKKDSDGNCFGGITFRAKADGLKPDEIKQLPASGFDPNDSEVLFVDYAD